MPSFCSSFSSCNPHYWKPAPSFSTCNSKHPPPLLEASLHTSSFSTCNSSTPSLLEAHTPLINLPCLTPCFCILFYLQQQRPPPLTGSQHPPSHLPRLMPCFCISACNSSTRISTPQQSSLMPVSCTPALIKLLCVIFNEHHKNEIS